jgi:hypothetical protein
LKADAKEKLLARLRAQNIELASLDSIGFDKLQKLRGIYQELLKLSETQGEMEEWSIALETVQTAFARKGTSSLRRRERIKAADSLMKQDRVFQGFAKGLGYSKARNADDVSSARIVPGGRADGNKLK